MGYLQLQFQPIPYSQEYLKDSLELLFLDFHLECSPLLQPLFQFPDMVLILVLVPVMVMGLVMVLSPLYPGQPPTLSGSQLQIMKICSLTWMGMFLSMESQTGSGSLAAC